MLYFGNEKILFTGEINAKDEIEFHETAKKLLFMLANEGNPMVSKLKVRFQAIFLTEDILTGNVERRFRTLYGRSD